MRWHSVGCDRQHLLTLHQAPAAQREKYETGVFLAQGESVLDLISSMSGGWNTIESDAVSAPIFTAACSVLETVLTESRL